MDLIDAATTTTSGHASTFVVSTIVILYLTFAAQLYVAAGAAIVRTREGRAVGLLITVFALCSLVGYGSMLLPVPYPVREAAHWCLAAATAALVWTNQARVIARMLGART